MDYVDEIRLGNKTAFEEIYHKYHRRFYSYVYKNTGSGDLAEEIVQMTFIKIWEKRAHLSSSFSIEIQLTRTATSIMIDLLRRKAVERKALAIIKQRTDAALADDPIAGKQLLEKVSATIDNLPPECRKIFILSREEGLSYSEIADRLSISPRTVENQVSKALKAVRKAVALCYILNL